MIKQIFAGSIIFITSNILKAESPSLDYIEMGYTQSEILLLNPDGFEFKVSKELSESYYLTGKYTDITAENYFSTSKSIGLGYKFNFGDSTSLFAELDITKIKVDASSVISPSNIHYNDVDEYQFNVITGMRRNFSKNTELVFAAKFDGIWERYDSLIVGANYRISDKLKIYGNFELDSGFSSGNSQYSIGLRYSF